MMALLFQFGWILLVCFLAEVLAALLPLPIPASVYGLLLMLAALGLKLIRVEQVKQASSFLVGILPILFLLSLTDGCRLQPGIVSTAGHTGDLT